MTNDESPLPRSSQHREWTVKALNGKATKFVETRYRLGGRVYVIRTTERLGRTPSSI